MKSSLYRFVWRWHFYAGIAVLPLHVWMAVTGALYLYGRKFNARSITIGMSPIPSPLSCRLAAHTGRPHTTIARFPH